MPWPTSSSGALVLPPLPLARSFVQLECPRPRWPVLPLMLLASPLQAEGGGRRELGAGAEAEAGVGAEAAAERGQTVVGRSSRLEQQGEPLQLHPPRLLHSPAGLQAVARSQSASSAPGAFPLRPPGKERREGRELLTPTLLTAPAPPAVAAVAGCRAGGLSLMTAQSSSCAQRLRKRGRREEQRERQQCNRRSDRGNKRRRRIKQHPFL